MGLPAATTAVTLHSYHLKRRSNSVALVKSDATLYTLFYIRTKFIRTPQELDWDFMTCSDQPHFNKKEHYRLKVHRRTP